MKERRKEKNVFCTIKRTLEIRLLFDVKIFMNGKHTCSYTLDFLV